MVKETDDGVVLAVKVVPGSSRTQVAGRLGETLKVTLAAPPEKGKANRLLLEVLAKVLRRPRSALAITSGAGSPRKEVHVAGARADEVRAALQEVLGR